MFQDLIALFTNYQVTGLPHPLVFPDYFLIVSMCLSSLEEN